MSNKAHTELNFEKAIEAVLISSKGGYIEGFPNNFNKEYALDDSVLFEFLEKSQPKQWKKLEAIHRKEAKNRFLQRLNKELELNGMLHVIRKGITDNGVEFKLAYFKPETSLNPYTEKQYQQNILTVTRQVKYSLKNENSLDMVLSLNGLPLATIELKNQFTGQNTSNAKRQYIEDRDKRELLFQFKKRALVHFAVDTDEVYFTTQLNGGNTRFFPFNKGQNTGAGNPLNSKGHRTAYLWEDVLQKDSWLDIVGKFIHLQVEEKINDKGKKEKEEAMIFPRYHQLDVVRKLSADAKINGAGKNYLIQHSAGSGKSNSIAWLAYRLFSLHNADDKKIFNSIVIITDRRVLDKQLQDTIYQFEHKRGVVQKIDKNTHQLRDALIGGSSIIITTLQKFPFILKSISKLAEEEDKNMNGTLKKIAHGKYAVIVDEAHSSQGGESTKNMKGILGGKKYEAEEDDDENGEDFIRESMLERGKQPNMSFFGFTATPKPKTIEVFGTKGKDGKPRPFHLYSMRQAIQEKFILDVLANYMTYKLFYKLSKSIEDDPEVNKKKASRAIARFVSLHPYNLSQKTEIIIEHFRQITSKQIGGRAKAMVVTGSRLHAFRYFLEFKKYIKEKGYKNVIPLVAFSGKLKDPDTGQDVTEEKLNGFKEKELPKKFESDKYKFLIVADKYQTGFDQPLLHTMYVDKKLSGVKAVQTLSRLNRIKKGKEDTFVLDFANEEQEIYDSFKPYYQLTTIEEPSDPNRLYDLKTKLEQSQVYWETEIEGFCNEYYNKKKISDKKLHGLLNSYIDPAVDRFKHLETEEEKDDFKLVLTNYIRAYSYLSQIMPFYDANLEKLFTYGRFLSKKLPKNNLSDRFKVTDEVSLEYYRLQKMSEGSIVLEPEGEYGLETPTEAGLKKDKEDKKQLSEIINIINDRFGTEFTEEDKLFFDQIEEALSTDETLQNQGKNNSLDNFKRGSFEELFFNKFIERMDKNSKITDKVLNEKDFADFLIDKMVKRVFDRING